MKKAYRIRIFIFVLILVLSVGAYEAAYLITQRIYADDEPYWENDDKVIPEADPSVETTTSPLFLLVEEDGYVVVKYYQSKRVYDETDICVNDLPFDLQNEIIDGIPINNFQQLYDFLENYSS